MDEIPNGLRQIYDEMKSDGEFSRSRYAQNEVAFPLLGIENADLLRVVGAEVAGTSHVFIGLDYTGNRLYWDVDRQKTQGSLLVKTSSVAEQRPILWTVASVLFSVNDPEKVRIGGIITPRPEDWKDFAREVQCPLHDSRNESGSNFLLHMAGRNRGRRDTAIDVILIEELQKIWEMDYEAVRTLIHIVEKGRQLGLTVMAGVGQPEDKDGQDRLAHWEKRFPVRLETSFRNNTPIIGEYILPNGARLVSNL